MTDERLSRALVGAATAVWLTGHALPVLAIAVALLVVAVVAAGFSTRRATGLPGPTGVAGTPPRRGIAMVWHPLAPPLRGIAGARAPDEPRRALLVSP